MSAIRPGMKSDDHKIQSLLQKLIYFDIFSYPLTSEELIKFSNIADLDENEGIRILRDLEQKKIISYHSGFYYLGNNPYKVTQRIRDNRLATLRMKTARRFAAIVANFPYVRAVFISGSLSKKVMKPDSDIDFFIITKPERLWLCRGFLTIFKKIFLGNSHRNLCINYFIDSESLEIPDRNIYTATEIAFLIPMFNYQLFREFISANQWIKNEYPNLEIAEENGIIKPMGLKKILETAMNNRIGDWLDRECFTVITRFWKKKFHWLDEKTFSFNLRSLKNVSKHHPNSYQNFVLKQYQRKKFLLELSTGMALFRDNKRKERQESQKSKQIN